MDAQSDTQAGFFVREIFTIHLAMQHVLPAEHILLQLQILEAAATDCGLQTMRGAELAKRGVHDGSGLDRRSAKGRGEWWCSVRARFSSVRFLANMCEHGGSKSRSVTPLRLASCPLECRPTAPLSALEPSRVLLVSGGSCLELHL